MASAGFQYEPVSLDVNEVCFEEEQDIPNTRVYCKATDHRPTNPLTGFQPTNRPPTGPLPTHRPLTHRPLTKQNTQNISKHFQSLYL